MIDVQQVRKQFKDVVAVDGISFQVAGGEIFGLLGPNGAGKTTSLRMLYGLLKPTAGTLTVDGIDVCQHPLAVQKRLGVLPDNGGLYTRLTARENIAYFGSLHGMAPAQIEQNIARFAEILGMHAILDRKTKGFSQGERMKVSLARALIHDPDYLLLDEPTNGLDVLTTRAVRRLLLELKSAGKAIIFSSHVMHEVEQLCDRAAIVAQGKIVAQGRIQDLLEQSATDSMEDAFTVFAYGPDSVHA